MKVEVVILNAFTRDGSGGNPAGVVLNADWLSAQQMQAIAQQVGLSETAFVMSSALADYAVRFFTPTAEIDFCGHATVAVYCLMQQRQLLKKKQLSQVTNAGILTVTIDAQNAVLMQLALPTFGARFGAAQIAAMLNIEPKLIDATQLPLEVVATGLADLMIPIVAGGLDQVVADHHAIAQFCRAHDLVGFHLFELPDQPNQFSAHCRNFAPLFGINEESATGSSSGALACYLHRHLPNAPTSFVFEQGRLMAQSSRLSAAIDHQGGKITNVSVGGTATISHTMSLAVRELLT